LRQAAHLAGYDREAAPVFARAGRLDGGVQGQDVGLESDAVDHAGDLGDALARMADAAHGLHHARDHFAGGTRRGGGAGGGGAGALGGAGVLVHCAAVAPSATTIFGLTAAISASSHGKQAAISSELGFEWMRRVPRGTHLKCLTALVT